MGENGLRSGHEFVKVKYLIIVMDNGRYSYPLVSNKLKKKKK